MSTSGQDAAALAVESRLPGFDGATGWLNSDPLTAADLRGRVVLVDFWTLTCINWLRTLGYVRAWAERYRDHGLVVVGVHTPEFPFEGDVENVRRAVTSLGVPYPVAIDSEYAVWRAFANHYWPADLHRRRRGADPVSPFRRGCVRRMRAGDPAAAGGGRPKRAHRRPRLDLAGRRRGAGGLDNLESPETYLGSEQGRNLADSSDALPRNHWALDGDWTIEPRASVLNAAGRPDRVPVPCARRQPGDALAGGDAGAVPRPARGEGARRPRPASMSTAKATACLTNRGSTS